MNWSNSLPADRDYFRFSQRGGEDEDPLRFIAKYAWHKLIDDHIWAGNGGPISDWDPSAHLVCTPHAPPEDFPDVWSPTTIGSHRAREFVEKHLPGHCQFLPVRMLLADGSPATESPYWVFNWLHRIDCLDKQKSGFGFSPFLQNPYYSKEVIDRSMIPPDIHVFRIKYSGTSLLFDRWAAELFVDAGLTGMWYDDFLLYYADDDDIPPIPPGWHEMHQRDPLANNG